MKGNWKNQTEIDRQKWDELVDSTPNACIYVRSFYLDATAIDWEAYIAEDYSFAIPVGIVKKGGVTRVYPPLFQGYIQPIGDVSKIDWNSLEKELIKRYSKGNIHLTSNELPNLENEKFIYQSVSQDEFKLKSQAKRKIKQFNNSNFEIREGNINTDELYQLVVQELSKKIPLFRTKNVQYLLNVINEAEKNGFLYKIGVFSGETLKGGLIGLKFNHELIYLKGAAEQEVQQEGAMYALMERFVQYGFSENCTINFGGSRIEGIRFFYQRFNGKDVNYFHYHWDNSPLWFKILYRLNAKIKRRSTTQE